MVIKKYLSLGGLTEYDALIKAEVNTKINDLSAEVAYIDATDNENITEVEGELISNEELNSLLTALEE